MSYITTYTLADGTSSTDYKEGDLFVAGFVGAYGETPQFVEGSIVKLESLDDSPCPCFKLVEGAFSDTVEPFGENSIYEDWACLKKYTVKEQDPETIIKQPDAFVRITQDEYDSLIDEINMLRELVAEITLETDYTALGQQASTYCVLNYKMLSHQSYKQGDGGSTREGELLEQLDTLFAAYDSLAGKQQFKPVSEMTSEDWLRAMEEGWIFETRQGDLINVENVFDSRNAYPVKGSNSLNYTLRGYFWHSGKDHEADIIERVK